MEHRRKPERTTRQEHDSADWSLFRLEASNRTATASDAECAMEWAKAANAVGLPVSRLTEDEWAELALYLRVLNCLSAHQDPRFQWLIDRVAAMSGDDQRWALEEFYAAERRTHEAPEEGSEAPHTVAKRGLAAAYDDLLGQLGSDIGGASGEREHDATIGQQRVLERLRGRPTLSEKERADFVTTLENWIRGSHLHRELHSYVCKWLARLHPEDRRRAQMRGFVRAEKGRFEEEARAIGVNLGVDGDAFFDHLSRFARTSEEAYDPASYPNLASMLRKKLLDVLPSGEPPAIAKMRERLERENAR